MKISVVAFDLSDNATGRADLLARLLAARWDVEVVGPQFGPSLWKPAEGGPVKHRTVRAGKYPGFLRRLPALLSLVDGDLIVASKSFAGTWPMVSIVARWGTATTSAAMR